MQPHPLVRLHSECMAGEVFGSRRCDCGEQLHLSLERVVAAQGGAVVYLRGHEGWGVGLQYKLEAYALQDQVDRLRVAAAGDGLRANAWAIDS